MDRETDSGFADDETGDGPFYIDSESTTRTPVVERQDSLDKLTQQDLNEYRNPDTIHKNQKRQRIEPSGHNHLENGSGNKVSHKERRTSDKSVRSRNSHDPRRQKPCIKLKRITLFLSIFLIIGILVAGGFMLSLFLSATSQAQSSSKESEVTPTPNTATIFPPPSAKEIFDHALDPEVR